MPAIHAQPDKVAVVSLSDGGRITYAALDRLVGQGAAWLADRLEAAAGARIAYLGRNSIEMLILSFAAERVGAIFVPVNWRLAAPEIATLIADCTPVLIVADAEFVATVPGAFPSGSLLDAFRRFAPAVASEPGPDRPIILLYTSGTTGQPKGVIVTSTNAQAAAANFAAVGDVTANSVTLSDLPMFHTIGLIAVARTTLAAGGTLVLADRFLPARTLGALADPTLGITHYFAVPVMVEALERDPAFAPAQLARLQAIFVGGAPLVPALVERFLGLGVPLVNGYGMSEAGTAIHVPINRDMIEASAGGIGRPAPHVAVRLVRDGIDVAGDDVGEIWLKGPSVTPGYWNRPAETTASFTSGWFRTGDLARRDADGCYHLVDRLKDMYVSGGENVYPAEIEAALAAHPQIADAAVVGIADPRWGETGIAFIVPRSATTVDADALRAFCLSRLARYKCPARFVAIDAIPRSPAGKILKPLLRHRLNTGEFP